MTKLVTTSSECMTMPIHTWHPRQLARYLNLQMKRVKKFNIKNLTAAAADNGVLFRHKCSYDTAKRSIYAVQPLFVETCICKD